MIYMIIASILFFLFIISLSGRFIDRYISSVFAFLILVSLAIFRGDVGTDYDSYMLLWQSITSNMATWYKEPGFVYSIKGLSYLGIDGPLYYKILSFLTLTIAYFSVVRLNLRVTAFLFFYFLFLYLGYVFNIMRQGIAMSLFLLSLTYLLSGKKYKYFLTMTVAMSFHYISVLIGVSYFWCRLRMRSIILIVIGMVLLKFSGVMNFLLAIIFGTFFPSKVDFYVTNAESEMSFINIAQRVTLVCFLFLIYNLSGKEKVISIMLKIYLLGFGLYFLLSDYGILSGRVYMFFCIVVPAMFARYCYIQRNRFNSFLLGVGLTGILLPSLWILAYTPEFNYIIR